ncbi:methylenetetrahydrofolate--tRNA-(uracil(54)-C(5))-methyltransferase (FADH(2)-oxidizing) TrmFO [Anaerorhabdus sp.]|uniref:methylenetetrahydrofolate--tRNA-(uracil(54)- C(5))-methyltransferase (FADH(2)-oxidizing) TrmFO n=1 Tax=Anaerorhabdus sp. TaxID=1872524 RepID=UPI002B219F4D|nr:methylenetetrahydrofolate--tRNA-(uracil(54)-C(5))-methyltransferase (FADH(2)-oxidizing) TrmFO [Anaerorhabdus sp.]MEA4875111.1 methylenetetrahydrofolate--tRNA-(uracil(54)-C(5))-methyltransferase (FADH(2)-oxidizing) TrmFO [Anaerorhabdus sp.]
MSDVIVLGAGLAGTEAAWQLANRGFKVKLIEMRPKKMTPAHKTEQFAELVCSNSLRSDALTNAVGLLKEEMRLCNSLIMKIADETKLPAGSALAVDREGFAKRVTEEIINHPNIEVVYDEITEIPEGPCIIATGPLTSDDLSKTIQTFFNADHFYFYDAAAPIIEKDSINFDKAYLKSRYDKGEADYINCPMTRDEFDAFYRELIQAETVPIKEFEKEVYFEGCMPFEVMAKRGMQTLLFGPMKPVGLEHNGVRPYAVVQLRQDNAVASLYNIVGFQTHLTWPEQKRILQMIPGLENCQIVRYGVMHRNSFINSPVCLKETYQSVKRDDLFFAGQMTGVEGYVESAASGLLAGINMAKVLNHETPIVLGNTCMMGAMVHYITHADEKHFQPMNANFGILKLEGDFKKKDKKDAYAPQALKVIQEKLCK